MDSNENIREKLHNEQNRQIQLVLNNATEEESVDLGNVFRNMKLKKRIFAWVLALCFVTGICIPILVYQFTQPELTVSSLVMLRYEVQEPRSKQMIPVSDLTAPDGTELDLNQITSAYVLQTALDGVVMSRPLTLTALRNNIRIQTVLTEESQRTKEALAGLVEVKNADAYNQLQEAEMRYQNRFVVSLTNGFKENEDSRFRTELTDAELKQLLDRILTVYNEYLVRTYADIKLPDDAFSVIDITELDVLDSLDMLRGGIDSLYAYCDEKSDTVKGYRSWQTGRNLADWMETLQTFKSINVDYLYSTVSEQAMTRDKTALLTGWKYLLREAQSSLDEVNERIAETQKILTSYKNDEVIVSMQESDAAKSTKASTRYYNDLILQQTEDYKNAAKLQSTIADYTDRISRMSEADQTEVTEEVETELAKSVSSAQILYEQINAHMEELFESPLYKTFEDHSAAQGKKQSFLQASYKKMIIGGIGGAVIAFGLWFLAALLPEFSRNRKDEKTGKEAVEK